MWLNRWPGRHGQHYPAFRKPGQANYVKPRVQFAPIQQNYLDLNTIVKLMVLKCSVGISLVVNVFRTKYQFMKWPAKYSRVASEI